MLNSKGYTLIEMMVATTLATLMSLGVLGIFINQTSAINTESQRDIAHQSANHTFELVSRLLRQAVKSSIVVSYPTNKPLNDASTLQHENDSTVIDFLLPEGYHIWPNDKPPYINNAIRLRWTNEAQDDATQTLQIAKAESISSLQSRPMQTIVGDNSGDQAGIINFDVWPMQNTRTPQPSYSSPARAGYLLAITTRNPQTDQSFVNPLDKNGPLQHYRTHTVSGIIYPRN